MSYISNKAATSGLSLTANGIFQQYTPAAGLPAGYTDNTFLTQLGTRWDLEDGREVVLVLAGAVNLAEGKLMQDAALLANNTNLAVTSFTAYSNNGNVPAKIVVTNGGTAITANQYRLGYAVVNDGTGAGQTLQIAENNADATGTGAVTLTLADGPNTALDVTSKITLVSQPGNGVIIYPHTGMTNGVRGVTFYPITAGNYGYLAVKGNWACLADATAPVANSPISPSAATDGAVAQTPYATNVVTGAVIGYSKYATVSGKYYEVEINL